MQITSNTAKVIEIPTNKPSRRVNKAKKAAKFLAAFPNVALQMIASGAAAIIPVATYTMSHFELTGLDVTSWQSVLRHLPTLLLIAAGLAYSAPTVAEWALIWTGSREKAWAFTVLLEGVQTFCHLPVLPVVCLCWLAGINLMVASVKAGKRKIKLAR